MIKSYSQSCIYIVLFCVSVLTIAIAYRPQYAALVCIGETSVATWLSGVLLVISATVCLFLGIKTDKKVWIWIFGFFMLLALDERFMFHERAKEYLIFGLEKPSRWIYELPVLFGAFAGSIVGFRLWKLFSGTKRYWLLLSILCGLFSVWFDLFSKGVLVEECFKLMAELLLTCTLLQNLEKEIK